MATALATPASRRLVSRLHPDRDAIMTGLPAIGDLGSVPLEPEEFSPGAVIEGSPRMASHDLCASPDERVFSGIWSVTPGAFHDVMDGNETFVVLARSLRLSLMPSPAAHPHRRRHRSSFAQRARQWNSRGGALPAEPAAPEGQV